MDGYYIDDIQHVWSGGAVAWTKDSFKVPVHHIFCRFYCRLCRVDGALHNEYGICNTNRKYASRRVCCEELDAEIIIYTVICVMDSTVLTLHWQ